MAPDVPEYLLASRSMMAWRGEQGRFAPAAYAAAVLQSMAQTIRAAAAAAMRSVIALSSQLGVWVSLLVQPHPPEMTLGLFLILSN